MKIIIIGGVAAGTSAAVRARRNSEEAEIVIYDRDVDIAHAGFATHYVVGGVVDSIDELTPNTPKWFKDRYNIDVHTGHDITQIDHDQKMIFGEDLKTGEKFEDAYDVLVFANGSSVSLPPVFRDKSFSNMFTIKNVQRGRRLGSFIEKEKPKSAIVVGTGYIGLGVSEQLTNIGIDVTTVDFLEYPMAQLDHDTSVHITGILEENGVTFHGKEGVIELKGEEECLKKVITTEGHEYEADMFVVATGVRPNTQLAESIGVEIGTTGAIKVNDQLQTNLEDVYAVGDVAEAFHVISKEPLYLPLATTASKMGRIAGDVITGGNMRFKGILGTSAVRLFGQTIAATGYTEQAVRNKGIKPVVLTTVKPAVLKFMGGEDLLIKAIAHPDTEELLGVQMIGPEGVERRIDVFATAMTFGAKVSDLFQIDLAFTPPISTPKDPVMYTGMALSNAIQKTPLITPEDLNEIIDGNKDYEIIDVRSNADFNEGHIENAINIPVESIRDQLSTINKDKKIVLYCITGENAYIAQDILLNNGFKDVYNLSGGLENYKTLYANRLTTK